MFNYISYGGGVQSTCMSLKGIMKELTPIPDGIIFADPGWERQSTYDMVDFVEAFAKDHNVPFYRVTGGNIRDDVLNPDVRAPSMPFFINTQRIITVEKQREELEAALDEEFPLHPSETQMVIKSADVELVIGEVDEVMVAQYKEELQAWDEHKERVLANFDRQVAEGKIKDKLTEQNTAMLRRQCTNDYKIRPITKLIKALTGCTHKNPVCQWLGISMDEVQRMKPSRVKYVKFRYPLIEEKLYRHDCLEWMEKHGFPKPERSSCIGCPFHSDDEWRSLNEEEFEDACQFDEKKRESGMTHPQHEKGFYSDRTYLHRSLKPLRTRPFRKKIHSDQLSLFEGIDGAEQPNPTDDVCDSGHCFN